MPATVHEMVEHVMALLAGQVMPDTVPVWADGTTATDAELREVQALLIYEVRYRLNARLSAAGRKAQRRARKLLARFLTAEQREHLARRRSFVVTAPSGRHYRFTPSDGRVEQVTRHGSRYYAVSSYCIHPVVSIPPADVTISQLLLLSADEQEFCREAHETTRRDQLWNGAWQRQLRRTTRERQLQEHEP